MHRRHLDWLLLLLLLWLLFDLYLFLFLLLFFLLDHHSPLLLYHCGLLRRRLLRCLGLRLYLQQEGLSLRARLVPLLSLPLKHGLLLLLYCLQ
jgi:hypothetical protein